MSGNTGTVASDVLVFLTEASDGLPVIETVLKTLKTVREKVATLKNNREELAALHQRCTYITGCVIARCRKSSSGLNATPLMECVNAVGAFVERCSRRGMVSRVLKATDDKDEIAGLKQRLEDLEGDLRLAGIATVGGKVEDLKALLEHVDSKQALSHNQTLANHDIMFARVGISLKTLATVPAGTPARKSWHVERRHVMRAVCDALPGEGGPRLVGLVGESGSGKTTAAAEIVRSTEVREAFSDGIVWLSVNDGATERLRALMMHLARVVYEDIRGSVGRRPAGLDDGAAYIRQRMQSGHGGKGLKCLVVADNVWEEAVISKLLETGMWVLLSTRDEALVRSAEGGVVVGVDELSEEDAMSVLRRASELSPELCLPDDAVELVELCGRVAMDVAFVGRWSTVRGRSDRTAWSDAAAKVRSKIERSRVSDNVWDVRAVRRKAVLQAGFEDLAIGSDDERIPRLYLSLAVLPDGHAFTAKDATALLYDRAPCPEDEVSTEELIRTLERWSALRTEGGAYRMHDAHSGFARDSVMDRGYVRKPAVKRWTLRISSLDFLRSFDDPFVLKGLWLAVGRLGGECWRNVQPYAAALSEMDESNPLLLKSLQSLGWFQDAQGDWQSASATCRRILVVKRRQLGADHPHTILTLRALVFCAERLGNAEELTEWQAELRRVLPLVVVRMQLRLDAGEVDGVDDANALNSIASTMLNLAPDDRANAEALMRRSLEIQEAKLGRDDVYVAYNLHHLGVSVHLAGRLDEAEGLFRRSLEIQEAKLDRDDVWLAYTQHCLGKCARQAGRLDEAEELLTRCLGIQEAKLGPDDVEVANTLIQLGLCLREAGRLEEAEGLLRRSLTTLETKFGPEDERVASALNELRFCVRQGTTHLSHQV
ncbi:unnamed protein product [Ectocarpus sp. 12 AP-2014]